MPTKSDLTPDSKREQDESKNLAQHYYDREFNDIAKNYDEETADPKDEDAAAERARLADSEDGAGKAPKKQSDDVSKGEEKSGKKEDGADNFARDWNNENLKRGGVYGVLPKSKRARIGLAIVLALSGIGLPLSFFTLFSFQLPAFTDMITDDAGERVQKLVSGRAAKIFFRAMYDKFGNDYDGRIVFTGSLYESLMATMKTAGFEQEFKRTSGYSIEKNGGVVRLVHDGKTVVTARNADELQRLVEQDKLVGKDFKTIARSQYPFWRYFKAKKFARWLRLQYGIPRYGYDNKDTGDPEKDGQEMYKDRLKRMYDVSAGNFLKALNCLMGEANCIGQFQSNDQTAKGNQLAAGEIVDEAITETLNQEGDPTKFKKFQEVIIETLLKKIGSKAVPIFGWIDIAASLSHYAYVADKYNLVDFIGIFFRKQAAAQEYADLAGIGDQVKWGQREGKDQINPYFVGMVAQQYATASEERAFNYVDGKPDIGTELASEDRINDDGKKSTLQFIVDENFRGDTVIGFVPFWIFEIYYQTIGEGGILGWLSGKVAGVFGAIASFLTPDKFEKAAIEFIARNFVKFMAMLGRIFVDPNDTSLAFTRAYMGATVSFDEHCKLQLDCRKMTDQEANDIRTQRWDEEYIGFKSRPLHEQIFATDTHRSFVSQVSMRNPMNSTDNINLANIAKAFGNMFSYAASQLTTPANAWDFSYRNLFNSPPMGASRKDLEQPIAKEVFGTDAECPEDLEGTEERTDAFYPCKADSNVIKSMGCMVDMESELCKSLEESASAQTDPGTQVSKEGWFWPDKTNAGLTNCYRKPSGGRDGHTGIDLGVSTGTDVFAAKTGHIASTGGGGDSGNYIIIDHGDNTWSNYQHLQTVYVKTGSVVGGQTRIATSDNTGYSTGDHLHFSITTEEGLDSRKSVSFSVNPLNYLPKDGRNMGGCN